MGGHHKQVETYRTQHQADVSVIAEGYAIAGDHQQVETYRTQHQADVDLIAEGYAIAGNHDKQKEYNIIYLLDCYSKERTAVVDSSGKTKEYLHGKFFAAFQYSYSDKQKAINALKSALKGNNVDDLITYLPTLRNGRLGKALRAMVKSGITNALVESKVNSVSEFVRALQEKNNPTPIVMAL